MAGQAAPCSVLRGLDAKAALESTPAFDSLMADVGSLFDDAPWYPQYLEFPAWKTEPDYQIPDDYDMLPIPIHLVVRELRSNLMSLWDTQLMKVIE